MEVCCLSNPLHYFCHMTVNPKHSPHEITKVKTEGLSQCTLVLMLKSKWEQGGGVIGRNTLALFQEETIRINNIKTV